MAITSEFTDLKLSLQLDKGTQTVGNLKTDATDESLYAVATAVSPLLAESIANVVKKATYELSGTVEQIVIFKQKAR